MGKMSWNCVYWVFLKYVWSQTGHSLWEGGSSIHLLVKKYRLKASGKCEQLDVWSIGFRMIVLLNVDEMDHIHLLLLLKEIVGTWAHLEVNGSWWELEKHSKEFNLSLLYWIYF